MPSEDDDAINRERQERAIRENKEADLLWQIEEAEKVLKEAEAARDSSDNKDDSSVYAAEKMLEDLKERLRILRAGVI